MKATGPTSERLQKLIIATRKTAHKEKAPIWKRISEELGKPTRTRRTVNIIKINKLAKEDETVIIPGKVLGTGLLEKKITIAAYEFSAAAKEKINKKGKALTIKQLLQQNPKGKGLRIIC